jgi:NAD(P)-dependent dehydrogenase (short-subunit alcohol dehydrogenase family)
MGVMQLFNLEGRRALITGASRGLGREIALALAEAGADTVIVARDKAVLEKAAEQIRAFGRNVGTIQADISEPDRAERMARHALDAFGHFDILVNNVGNRLVDIPTEELTYEDWKSMVDLNLTHCFLCSRIIGREMIRRKSGKIINIASISGMIVNRGIFGRAYETSKAAVVAFTRTLAVDWAAYNINVNAIAPGYFLTDVNRDWFQRKPELAEDVNAQIPMGRCGEPREIGALAVYLASDASSYMTGSTLVIDGGYTLW